MHHQLLLRAPICHRFSSCLMKWIAMIRTSVGNSIQGREFERWWVTGVPTWFYSQHNLGDTRQHIRWVPCCRIGSTPMSHGQVCLYFNNSTINYHAHIELSLLLLQFSFVRLAVLGGDLQIGLLPVFPIAQSHCRGACTKQPSNSQRCPQSLMLPWSIQMQPCSHPPIRGEQHLKETSHSQRKGCFQERSWHRPRICPCITGSDGLAPIIVTSDAFGQWKGMHQKCCTASKQRVYPTFFGSLHKLLPILIFRRVLIVLIAQIGAICAKLFISQQQPLQLLKWRTKPTLSFAAVKPPRWLVHQPIADSLHFPHGHHTLPRSYGKNKQCQRCPKATSQVEVLSSKVYQQAPYQMGSSWLWSSGSRGQ